MKKLLCLLLPFCMVILLAACSGGDKTETTAAVATTAETQEATETAEKPAAPSADGVDIDLTAMSGTMVYSEVLNMQQKPEEYLGKIVKMKGPFNCTETENNRYFACIIKDATACCSTGIEFEWEGDHSYPEDYPEANQEITVVGEFTTYTEGKSRYLQLKNAKLEF